MGEMKQSKKMTFMIFMIIFYCHLMCPYCMLGPLVTHFICPVTLEVDTILPVSQMRELNLKEFT